MNAPMRDAQVYRAPLLASLAADAADAMADSSSQALHAARRCLVDWLGVALAGMASVPARTLAAALGGGDHVLGAPGLNARDDALLMATAGHVLDYDDTDPVNLVHVSASVLPALFAVARRHHVSGRALLRALIAGYEIESRLGSALGRPLTARGWHVSGVLGHFGAAAATALALGAPSAIVAQAMAIAASGASGFIASFGTMTKSLQLGRTAAGGVLASALAIDGFTGPVDIFESGVRFAGTLVDEPALDWSSATRAWGDPYAITRNSFKPHASCMITHPAIDAAIAIHARRSLSNVVPAAIESIECRVNRLAPQVAGHTHPATGLQGKFSVAYCVATALLDGRATAELFTDDGVARDSVAALLDRTTVVADDAVGEQQAIVTVRLAGGRTEREHVLMALGHDTNPMSDAALGEKFTRLASPALGARTAPLLRELWQFDAIPDAGGWLQSLVIPY